MRPEFEEYSTFYDAGSILKCEEKKKKFYLKTGNAKFIRVKIDKGVIPESLAEKRCDYIVIKQGEEDIEVFVELKSEDMELAKEQLKATYKKYVTKPDNVKRYPAIVFTSNGEQYKPPKTRTKITNFETELRDIFGNKVLKHKDFVEAQYVSTTNSIKQTN